MGEGRQRGLYLPQLDGIRALAVAAVVMFHAQLPFVKGGGVGVDVFFVVSGYLISGLLIREHEATGGVDFRAFYLRRARRLLPALVLVCAVSLPAFLIVRPFNTPDTVLGIGASLIYASSWLRALDVSDLGWFGHTWSLSIEEFFYLVWPVVLCVLLRRRLGSRLFGAVAMIWAGSVIYRIGLTAAGVSGEWLYHSPDARAEQLLFGCLLAVVLPFGGSAQLTPSWKRPLDVLVVLSLVSLLRTALLPGALGAVDIYMGPTLVAAESAIIIGYVISYRSSRLARLLSLKALVWTGRRSYGIYLWHFPLFGLLSFKGEPTIYRVAGRGLAMALTVVAAAMSYSWVESRFYRRRVDPAPGREGSQNGEAMTPTGVTVSTPDPSLFRHRSPSGRHRLLPPWAAER